VLELVRQERARGATIVLATASDQGWARRIAAHLGLFDDVLASDGQSNLKGRSKLEAIENYCRERDLTSFAYVGDARADLPIWREAKQVYAVAPGRTLLSAIRSFSEPACLAGGARTPRRAALRAMRPQQWVKNLLVFVPLLLAHQIKDLERFWLGCLAFIAFSACASAVYVVNDLLDIEADRNHPHKKRRPFAAGDLPIQWGPILVVLLLAVAFGIAVAISGQFTGLLLLYMVMTTLYSVWLKTKVMADVLVLAGLYTLRIIAGGAAVDVPVSEWLMAFSMFLFTSLAFAKRYSELQRLAQEGGMEAKGRGYLVGDLGLVENLGPTSGYMAVVVLALYIKSGSEHMQHLYANVKYLWLICPLLLYWISRLWLLAKRGLLPEDPVVFALKDWVSLAVGAFAGLRVVAATLIP
jgi:4-hydroxybenzoate polyprenyltransferase